MKTGRFIVMAVCFALLLSGVASAEMKTFIRDYTYQASEADSKQSCRVLATEQVKRLLLEELGTYLESHTEVVNSELTKDQINTLTAGIVKTSIVAEKWDGQDYWLQAKMVADPDEVARTVEKLSKDGQSVKKLEDDRRNREITMKDIDSLRKDMVVEKDNPQKVKEYNDKIQSLRMLQGVAGVLKAVSSDKPEQGVGAMFEMFGDLIRNAPK